MKNERLEELIKMAGNEPDDPFLVYAIAMELRLENPPKALEYLEDLLVRFSGYLPAYYQAGKLYEDLGNDEAAKDAYRRGMSLAEKSGDLKTFQELKSALELLEFD